MKYAGEGLKIVFGGDKGGTGKTTGAVSVACALAARGYKVALLDSDTKVGAAKWIDMRLDLIQNLRNNPEVYEEKLPSGRALLSKSLLKKLQGITFNPITCEQTTGHIHRAIVSLAKEHDFVIVDTAGGIKNELTSALAVADLFVSPLKASSFDLQTVEELSVLIDQMKVKNNDLKAVCYLNEVPTGSMDDIAVPKSFMQQFEHIEVCKTVIKSYRSHRASVSFGASVMEWDDAQAKGQVSLLTDEFLKILGV